MFLRNNQQDTPPALNCHTPDLTISPGALFTSAILVFIAVIKRPIRITKGNSQKYIEITYKIIAANRESLLKKFALEIEKSIEAVVNMANSDSCDIETVKKANTILMLWSDKYFCRMIVEHAVYTLYTAINCVKNQSNYRDVPGRVFIQELISQSITSESSLLNRENEYYGLGLFKNMTTEMFGDYEFVNSKYRPLDVGLKFYKINESVNPRYIKNYFMCLVTALKACIVSGKFNARYNPFVSVFDDIVSINSSMALKLRTINDLVSESHPYLVLSEISMGFHRMIDALYEYDIAPSEPIDDKYDYLNDRSIYGVVAWGVFKFLESLSVCVAHDNLVRGLAVIIWLDIAGEIKGNDQILRRVVFHLTKKVNDNVINGRYPMVTRLLISLDGLSEPKMDETDDPRIGLCNHVMHMLKTNYNNIFHKSQTVAKDMLPENVTYDSENKLLIAKYFIGENATLKVD